MSLCYINLENDGSWRFLEGLKGVPLHICLNINLLGGEDDFDRSHDQMDPLMLDDTEEFSGGYSPQERADSVSDQLVGQVPLHQDDSFNMSSNIMFEGSNKITLRTWIMNPFMNCSSVSFKFSFSSSFIITLTTVKSNSFMC